MRPSRDEQREHDLSARALLAIEAATVEIITDDTRSLPSNADDAAEELRLRIDRTFQAARRASRRQSRERLRAELEVVRQKANPRGRFGLTLASRSRESDAEEARRAADHLADLVRRRAKESDVRTAVARTRTALNASARLVTIEAWGDERERVLRALEREEGAVDVLPVLGKFWDARLDACPVCRRLDGTVRPAGVDFPGGAVAGIVHASCRCFAHLVFAPVLLDNRSA